MSPKHHFTSPFAIEPQQSTCRFGPSTCDSNSTSHQCVPLSHNKPFVVAALVLITQTLSQRLPVIHLCSTPHIYIPRLFRLKLRAAIVGSHAHVFSPLLDITTSP